MQRRNNRRHVLQTRTKEKIHKHANNDSWYTPQEKIKIEMRDATENYNINEFNSQA